MSHRLLQSATTEQRAAILHDKGPAFVSAAPGSGKCVIGNTLIPTERGIIPISDIPQVFDVDDNQCKANLASYSLDQTAPTVAETSHWFEFEPTETIKIVTDSGYTITGTPEHKILTVNTRGDLEFKRLDAITADHDAAIINCGANMWGDSELDPNITYTIGFLFGKTSSADAHTQRLAKVVLGIDLPFSHVPDAILRSNKSTVVHYLRGLFDTKAQIQGHSLCYTTTSQDFAAEVQSLLLNLGVRSKLTTLSKTDDSPDEYQLQISGLPLLIFHSIGLLERNEEKIQALNKLVGDYADCPTANNIFIDPVRKVSDGGTQKVYDFTVPNEHAFVGNGIVNHNTRVITYRCAYLLDKGVDPRNIVGITFTNKAANEMKSRLRKLVNPKVAKKVWLSTFHSFCVRLLRSAPSTYHVHPSFGIADASDSKDLVTLAVAQILGKTEKEVRAMSKEDGNVDLQHIRRWISKHKNEVHTPADLEAKKKKLRFSDYIRYYIAYERILKKNGLLDFDDLLLYVVLGLRKDQRICDFYAQMLKYMMVDEWQDTNRAQFEIVRHLCKSNRNLFVVGDLEQSIYKFRGAKPENTDDLFKFFPDAKTYLLTKNFRSRPGIATLANMVIGNNDRKHAKDIVPHKTGGDLPQCIKFGTPDDEAGYIANTIEGLVRSKKYKWQDFAVIYRIRSLSRPVEDACVYRNIPYRVIGANTFYNRSAVKDLLAYLRLIAFPHDNAAYTRIYNKPTRGIGAVNFNRFADLADQENISLLQAHLMGKYKNVVQPSTLHGFRSLKKLFSIARKMDHDKVAPLIQHIIKHSNYTGYIDKIRDKDRRENVANDVRELVSAASAFDDHSKRKGIKAYLDHVTLMQRDDKTRDDNMVTLMTAHASKGSEYKNVFLIGCAEGVLPLPPRDDAGEPLIAHEDIKEHYEEERRVFYVATTRAEDNLWITWPEQRRFSTGIGNQNPSMFLTEAEGTMVEKDLTQYHGKTPSVPWNRKKNNKNGSPRKNSGKTYHRNKVREKVRAKDGGVKDIIEMKKKGNKNDAWEIEIARRREVANSKGTGGEKVFRVRGEPEP